MSGVADLQQVEAGREFHDYCLYGMAIRSEIPLTFPERPRVGPADVVISVASSQWFAEMRSGLPAAENIGDWYERVSCADGSDYLHFSGLFEFMVPADGRSVTCGLLERATPESFQTYLFGHVLSYALVKQGYEPLHATTVVVDGEAIAFLGDSGRGKSTLAAAFLHAGHKMLTDDLLLIGDVGGVLCGSPGPPRIKLFSHIARQFLPDEAAIAPMNPDTEKLIIGLGPHHVHGKHAPIRAFVVLDDWKDDCHGIRLSSLSGTECVIQLLGSTFNRRLVTSARLRRQFLAAREWLERIPVWRLEYPRELTVTEAVRETILSRVLSAQKLPP